MSEAINICNEVLRYCFHCEQTNLSIQNGQFSYSFLLLQKGNGWFERLKNKKINNKEWKRLGDGLARKTR